MPTWTVPLEILGQKLDRELLGSLMQVASVRADAVRRELDAEQLAWVDASTGRMPEVRDLDATAEVLTARAARQGRNLGGATAVVGLAGVPPEVVGALVQSLRLCQRLAVVYGFDPDTDAGRLMVWRAMAAAWELPFPGDSPSALRLRELPDVIRAQLPTPTEAAVWAGQAAGRSMIRSLRKRVARLIPGLTTVLGAVDGQRRVAEQSVRAQAVLRRASPALDLDLAGEEEAQLVAPR